MKRLALVLVLLGTSLGTTLPAHADGTCAISYPAPYWNEPSHDHMAAGSNFDCSQNHYKMHLYAALQRRFDNTESWVTIDSFKKNPCCNVQHVGGTLVSGQCETWNHGWQYHLRILEAWAVDAQGNIVHQFSPPILDSPIKTVDYWCAAA